MSMKIGIVGLGLIGGSFAKAVKQNTEHTVWGYDISETVIQHAITAEAIDGFLTDERLGSCDMIIVALYPGDTVKYVIENASLFRKDCVVIDCCGVKSGVVSAIAPVAYKSGFYFIGGHPMAGIEYSGFMYSKPDLFRGASMILTPTTGTASEIVDMVSKFCIELGFGHIQLSTPEHHDKMIALTSQLAHVISSAYVQSNTALDFKGFSAGSFMDMTRVARLNEHMWTELFIENSEYLADEIDGMIERLKYFSDIIKSKSKSELIETLKQGSDRKKFLTGEEL
jgi:prephenate dehydrogenase